MSLTEEVQSEANGISAGLGSTETTPGPVRTKLFRSKTSCMKCRSRKAKCGALPPDTCPYCRKHGLKCVWPEVDGRRTIPRHSHRPSTSDRHHRHELSSAPQIEVRGPQQPTLSQDQSCDLSESALFELLLNSSNTRFPDNPALPNPTNAGLQTLLNSSSPATQTGPGSVPSWTVPSSLSQEPWSASFDLPAESLQFPFHDLSGIDPAAFFRDLFNSDISDVQMQVTNTSDAPARSDNPSDGVISIKVSRAHGRTAFVPGRVKVPFKVHVQPKPSPESPTATMSPSDGRDTYSDPAVLKHLLGVFKIYFLSQIPCVDCQELEEAIDRDPSPSFLMNCVAAAAARFSTDSRIARKGLEAGGYGDVYYERAHAMLGNVVKIPLRETVIGFTILAYCADSSTGTWTMAGLATRMAVDLGLHRRDHPSTPPETARQNRLCFWSLLILDTIVSFGVGRETSFRPDTITQDSVPEDLGSLSRSPFLYAADMMRSYGPLINHLNNEVESSPVSSADLIRAERAKIMRRYHELPSDMAWSTENLKLHNNTGQASMFLQLHMWFHAVLSSSMVAGDNFSDTHRQLGTMGGVLTPSDKLNRSGAKMITEYVTMCDIINPAIYYNQRFLGQPLFTAAKVILQELRRHVGSGKVNGEPASERNLTTSLLSSMADGQIEVIRKVMTKTGFYWRGAAVVKEVIEHLVQGRREEDQIWGEDESYAIEMYAWSLPGKYRVNGAQVN